MSEMPVNYSDAGTRSELPKLRPCLMCKKTFRSEWSGERICGRCKGGSAWRSGVTYESGSSGGRR